LLLEPRLPRIGATEAVVLEARASDLARRSIKKESRPPRSSPNLVATANATRPASRRIEFPRAT